MALEKINTLWGESLIIEENECGMPGCDAPRHNAGDGRYHRYCSYHHKEKYGMKGWYKVYRKDYCENIDGRLGFKCTTKIVLPRVQLHIDHIDGFNDNNEEDNLQTLCADCHAIKTMVQGENLAYDKRPDGAQLELRWEKFLTMLKENKHDEIRIIR
jgi:hypothetical protein